MTAIINLMGTQDIFDAIKCFVFELMTKNHIAINFMAHAPRKIVKMPLLIPISSHLVY